MSEENQIRPRDLDKVREKNPIYVEPKHIFWAILSSLFLLVIAFIAGFMVGKSRVSEAEVSKDQPRTIHVAQSTAIETGVSKFQRNAVRLASVLPVPLRWHEPDLSLQASGRREAVEVQENTVNTASSHGKTDSPPPFPTPIVDSSLLSLGGNMQGQSAYKMIESETPKIKAGQKQNEQGQVSEPASQSGKAQLSSKPQNETFTIQVRSYRDREMALKFHETLKQKGYSPRLETHLDEQGNEWFRVMLGRFDSISQAKEFAKSFNSKENESAIVVQTGAKR